LVAVVAVVKLMVTSSNIADAVWRQRWQPIYNTTALGTAAPSIPPSCPSVRRSSRYFTTPTTMPPPPPPPLPADTARDQIRSRWQNGCHSPVRDLRSPCLAVSWSDFYFGYAHRVALLIPC